jgi:hypothetical protein
MSIEFQDVERFASLFTGNPRSFGQYIKGAKKESFTVHGEYTSEHIRSHLEGHAGLGLSPIMDTNKCLWAAIDIDVHGPNGQNVDLEKIQQQVERDKLPLIVCRSKSGGAHVYLFLKDWTEAARVRLQLTRWATVLGFPTAEIFPKQPTLDERPTDTEKPLGSWINLPYYKAEETDRWAIDGGRQVTFDYFLALAEGKRVDLHDYEHGADIDYAKGPPCLEEIRKARIEEGNRNVAVFQAAVYLKRAFPNDWKSRMVEFNATALVTPLAQQELRTIMGSVHKRDYLYKCREEPCKSFCNKEACRKREFGITDKDATANDIPLVEKVEKVITTPIRWDLHIKGQVVSVTTHELYNYELVRQRVGEKLHLVLPRLKNQEWDLYLTEIMSKVTVKEEMTIEGLIFERLKDFVQRAKIDRDAPEAERREELKRNMPAFISIAKFQFGPSQKLEEGPKTWHYAFKMMDFIAWMRRQKLMPVPDHLVHSHLTKILGEHAKRAKMRIGDTQIGNVWCMPEEMLDESTVPVPDKKFVSEF